MWLGVCLYMFETDIVSGLVQPWLLQVSGGGGGRVNQWMEDLSTFQVNKLHKRILPRGRTEGMCYF